MQARDEPLYDHPLMKRGPEQGSEDGPQGGGGDGQAHDVTTSAGRLEYFRAAQKGFVLLSYHAQNLVTRSKRMGLALETALELGDYEQLTHLLRTQSTDPAFTNSLDIVAARVLVHVAGAVQLVREIVQLSTDQGTGTGTGTGTGRRGQGQRQRGPAALASHLSGATRAQLRASREAPTQRQELSVGLSVSLSVGGVVRDPCVLLWS